MWGGHILRRAARLQANPRGKKKGEKFKCAS